jgi:hypothetical protein
VCNGATPDDERMFRSDMLMSPEDDWPVPLNALSIEDVSGITPIVRVFPDSDESGVGFSVFVPRKAAAMHLRLAARANISPPNPAGAKTVIRLYAKGDEGWSGPSALGYAEIPSSQILIDAEFTVNLRAMRIRSEKFVYFELTRHPRLGGLVGSLLLHGVGVTFVAV